MNLFFIGFIIGIGKILPGVSGSVLAIRMNVYDKIVDTISNFFNDIKNNSIFLLTIGIGFILSTVIGSKILYFMFDKYEFYFKVIFSILIASGIPELLKKSKSIPIVLLLSCIIWICLKMINNCIVGCNINFFIAGIIEALSTIIPGISGTTIYLNLGWYDDILVMFSNLYMFEFMKIIPFFFGFMSVSLIVVKVIDFVMKKYNELFYTLVTSFVIVSILFIF